MSATLPLDAIVVGERSRTDLGDVAALARSITDVGLLHPVVVTASNELVAGNRRMAAVRSLGWADVPVTVVDLGNVADVMRAEAAENTCRKALSPTEAERLRERIASVLRPAAEDRKRSGRPVMDDFLAEQVAAGLWTYDPETDIIRQVATP